MASRNLLQIIRDGFARNSPGFTGAVVGLVIGLLWVLFGFFRMLFILILGVVGYYVERNISVNRMRSDPYLTDYFHPADFADLYRGVVRIES